MRFGKAIVQPARVVEFREASAKTLDVAPVEGLSAIERCQCRGPRARARVHRCRCGSLHQQNGEDRDRGPPVPRGRTPRRHRRGLSGNSTDLRQESIAAPGDRLDESRPSRVVAERAADGGDAEVQAAVEIDVRVRTPEQMTQLASGHDLTGAHRQLREDRERLRRDRHPAALTCQLARRLIEFEHREAQQRHGPHPSAVPARSQPSVRAVSC